MKKAQALYNGASNG